MPNHETSRWLLLIHQLPTKPAYFRVKIGRQLQGLGAVAIKNSVYVLPHGDSFLEDFQWVLREIQAGGADATLVEAQLVEGLTNAEVRELFHAARNADYAPLVEEARALLKDLPAAEAMAEPKRAEVETQLARLRRRLAEIQAIDFFTAPGHHVAEELLAALEARLLRAPAEGPGFAATAERYKGFTWVTRKGLHVDRIACAWLIRRFLDPEARFRFVEGKEHRPADRELRFDMFEGEFTHEGDLCSFEVFVQRLGLADPGLQALAEVIHDIDLKDHRFDRPEAPGFARMIQGIALTHAQDEARIQAGTVLLEALYAAFLRGGP